MKITALLMVISAGILTAIFVNVQIGLLILLSVFVGFWIYSLFPSIYIDDPGAPVLYIGIIACITAILLEQWFIGVVLLGLCSVVSIYCNTHNYESGGIFPTWTIALISLIAGAIIAIRGQITIGLLLASTGLLLLTSWIADSPKQKKRLINFAKAREEQNRKLEERKKAFNTTLDQQITEAVNSGSLQPLLDKARGLYSYVDSGEFQLHRWETDIVSGVAEGKMYVLLPETSKEGAEVFSSRMKDIIRYFVKFAGTSKMFEKYTCPVPGKKVKAK